jgi:hypothetical protein
MTVSGTNGIQKKGSSAEFVGEIPGQQRGRGAFFKALQSK